MQLIWSSEGLHTPSIATSMHVSETDILLKLTVGWQGTNWQQYEKQCSLQFKKLPRYFTYLSCWLLCLKCGWLNEQDRWACGSDGCISPYWVIHAHSLNGSVKLRCIGDRYYSCRVCNTTMFKNNNTETDKMSETVEKLESRFRK